MLTVITPTGGRPQAFALLAECLNGQTLPQFHWQIVDDCDPATRMPDMRDGISVEIIRPAWRWQPGMNTQAACMTELLGWVDTDSPVVVCEDDDWYSPRWLATCAASGVDLFGQRDSYYYNVATKRYRHIIHAPNAHCSLSGTYLSPRAQSVLSDVCQRHASRLDIELWKAAAWADLTVARFSANRPQVVGIKGLPGRPGIGIGHRETFGEPDEDAQVWGAWMG